MCRAVWSVWMLLAMNAAVGMPVAAAADAPPQWQFVAHALDDSDQPSHCELAAQGEVHEAAGADLQLTCGARQRWLGNMQLALPARAMHLRRVQLLAEVRSDAAMNATLWLKTATAEHTLMFEDDTEQALFNDVVSADGWHLRVLDIPVDVDATQLRIGVLLQGSGALELRNVRLRISETGAMSPQAARYLDDAIAALRQHWPAYLALHWQLLEPQMRLLAQGAQRSEDVYPAIRYALHLAGNRHNMLVTPQLAQALPATRAGAQLIVLADGAQLLLAEEVAWQSARNALPAAVPTP